MRSLITLSTIAALTLAAASAHAAPSSFDFISNTSTSGPYDPTRDVRLDSVIIDGLTYHSILTVSSASILLDDGINFAAGRAPNSPADPHAPEGPATVTPTNADLTAALGNRNLTSLAVTRENLGTAILDVNFDTPASKFLFYERGSRTTAGNSDILIEALNDLGNVVTAYKVLRANYSDTGLVVSTDVGAFSVLNVKLGSIGIDFGTEVSRLRLISTEASNFKDGGPDYKIFALDPADGGSIPEPASLSALALGSLALLLRRRKP